MPACSHITDTIARKKVRESVNDTCIGRTHNSGMAEGTQNHLRAWRKFRKMTQDELAAAVDTSKSVISDLENERLQLSPKWLRRLAPVLGTQPGHLLEHDPEQLDTDILDLWSKIEARDRPQAVRVLRSFVKTGTDD